LTAYLTAARTGVVKQARCSGCCALHARTGIDRLVCETESGGERLEML